MHLTSLATPHDDREADGAVVDLAALQPLFDGKPVSSGETPESAGLL